MSKHFGKTEYLETAYRIGAQLARDAIWSGTHCNWITGAIDQMGGQNMRAFMALEGGFYSGTSGIALFLAQLNRYTGDGVIAGTAAGAITHALDRIDDLNEEMRFGLYTGRSGVAWAAVEVGSLLERPDLEERGLGALENALDAETSGRCSIDVMSGFAGVIPVLLRLHEKYGDRKFLDRACELGDYLVREARRTERGLSWNTLGALIEIEEVKRYYGEPVLRKHQAGGRDLLGLAHGCAGISWALLELGYAADSRHFLETAKDGFSYEESWYEETGMWPDLRPLKGQNQESSLRAGPLAWCHGATGIGLTRLRAYRLTGAETYQKQAERACLLTLRSITDDLRSHSPDFSLCHGLAGKADFLIMCEEVFNESECRDAAERVAAYGIENFSGENRPWPSGLANGIKNCTLMLGDAGVGYFFLRAYNPKTTPSILLPGQERFQERKIPSDLQK